jgi:hypothetical protein
MKLDNEPDFVDGKYLGKISSDFIKVADQLKEASYQIRTRKFSNYPIFPVSQTKISIGKLLFARFELKNEWYYYASMYEEFEQRKLIDSKMEEKFKQTYKDPDEFCCLFVVDEEFVNFVYIPYPVEDEEIVSE